MEKKQPTIMESEVDELRKKAERTDKAEARVKELEEKKSGDAENRNEPASGKENRTEPSKAEPKEKEISKDELLGTETDDDDKEEYVCPNGHKVEKGWKRCPYCDEDLEWDEENG